MRTISSRLNGSVGRAVIFGDLNLRAAFSAIHPASLGETKEAAHRLKLLNRAQILVGPCRTPCPQLPKIKLRDEPQALACCKPFHIRAEVFIFGTWLHADCGLWHRGRNRSCVKG